jgi:hypothetical protein
MWYGDRQRDTERIRKTRSIFLLAENQTKETSTHQRVFIEVCLEMRVASKAALRLSIEVC